MLNDIILWYISLNIGFLVLSTLCWHNFSFVNPIVIYKNIPVNWFGVILLTIILNLLFPPISICYWFYKLVTVGRKDEE
jgi:hypothetical protein